MFYPDSQLNNTGSNSFQSSHLIMTVINQFYISWNISYAHLLPLCVEFKEI